MNHPCEASDVGHDLTLTGPPTWHGTIEQHETPIDQLRQTLSSDRFAADQPIPQVIAGLSVRRCLGSGGTGSVYSAETESGDQVALKILHPDLIGRPDVIRRFEKEARLLQRAECPQITRYHGLREHAGLKVLVMELVEGVSLSELLQQRGRLDERNGIAIMIHVARAMATLHPREIIHRDIKPANILVNANAIAEPGETVQELPDGAVKLTDFGLARQITQEDSLVVTRKNVILGTPQYLAPEQCFATHPITAAADIYAIGATLFHVLAGRPPYAGDNLWQLIDQHRHCPAPRLESLVPSLSDAVCRIIAKSLEKHPEFRYADGTELLADLERLWRGEPISINPHPCVVGCPTGHIREYELSCNLKSSPESLWPYVANTERINRAADLPSVEFSTRCSSTGEVQQFAEINVLGVKLRWREHPFEWVEAKQMSVLREFECGPLRWLTSTVELYPRVGGGTNLVHRFRVSSHGWPGRLLSDVQIGRLTRRAFDRVYHRIDAVLCGAANQVRFCDPFEPPAKLSARQRDALAAAVDRLCQAPVDRDLVIRLGEFLEQAANQDVASIRPRVLARRWAVDSDDIIATCLHAARAQMLELQWDIHCPVCRLAAAKRDSLREVESRGRCDFCDIEFDTDFAHFVELVFRVHPKVRVSDSRMYCAGGPAHSPHVIAQCRVAAGESFALTTTLSEGDFRIRGPQLSRSVLLRVRQGGKRSRWHLRLDEADSTPPIEMSEGAQAITLTNGSAHELVVRMERAADIEDTFTAREAAACTVFRELFPEEVLGVDQPIPIENITFLFTQASIESRLRDGRSETDAYLELRDHLQQIRSDVEDGSGAIMNTVGDGVLAVFARPRDAVAVARNIQSAAQPDLGLRVAVHSGRAVLATVNRRLEYFGEAAKSVMRLIESSAAEEVIISDAAVDCSMTESLLLQHSLSARTVTDTAIGRATAYRLVTPRSAT